MKRMIMATFLMMSFSAFAEDKKFILKEVESVEPYNIRSLSVNGVTFKSDEFEDFVTISAANKKMNISKGFFGSNRDLVIILDNQRKADLIHTNAKITYLNEDLERTFISELYVKTSKRSDQKGRWEKQEDFKECSETCVQNQTVYDPQTGTSEFRTVITNCSGLRKVSWESKDMFDSLTIELFNINKEKIGELRARHSHGELTRNRKVGPCRT